jgi:hypothetical protein
MEAGGGRKSRCCSSSKAWGLLSLDRAFGRDRHPLGVALVWAPVVFGSP